MAITPEQIIDSLFELISNMSETIYEFKSENADDYNNQTQEIYEQYQEMRQ